MNSETSSALADAFREHREAFGVSIEIDGQELMAVVNESPYSRELIEGGFANEGDIEAKALMSEMAAEPAIGGTAKYKGRDFRIAETTVQPGSDIIEFRLRPSRGR
jgi:hypothetical protein